jgi:hypothetical protein
MEPRLMASPGHSGQGFFEVFVPDPPRGRPFAERRLSSSMEQSEKKSRIIPEVQFSGEMLNYTLNAQGGFHPRRCGSPGAINPEPVLRHHRSAQGRHGGTGSCPLLHAYQHPEFHSKGKGILQGQNFL